ncbi:hypothetical protein EPI10_015927 [Gossypium australe]|uniref:Uncharacterized protein n=1 Tax=Gossypium australe TaxID=47621 RepID=A0A5B6VLP4_9ROSI|nr:hypothetical protein EPI10_015927 [Gossypium australe]
MDSETPFTAFASPIFNGEGYQVWGSYGGGLQSYFITCQSDYSAYQESQGEEARKSKAIATLFVAVSYEIFLRIMTMKLTFEEGYEGDKRTKGMKILNLIREF